MAKTESGKKVAKVGRAGGGKVSSQRRGRISLFPTAIALVVVLGGVLVAVSRDSDSGAALEPALGTHWHAGYGIFVCDDFDGEELTGFQPPLVDRPGVTHNLHTHEDGLIHIHPISNAATGTRANLGVFADTTGLDLSSDGFSVPDGATVESGDTCGGEEGTVQLVSWDPVSTDAVGRPTEWSPDGTVFLGDVEDFRPQDDQLITLAFVAEDDEVPQPPSSVQLAAPIDEASGAPVPLPLPTPDDGVVDGGAPAEEPDGETVPAEDGVDDSAVTDGSIEPDPDAAEDSPAADGTAG